MISHSTHQILNRDNKVLTFDIRQKEDKNNKPLCIILHGFKGFRNWGFFPYSAEYFATNGFISLNLDFSHTAVADEKLAIYDAELFAKNTLSKEVNDCIDLINHLDANKLEELENWNNEIYLIGHSLGGAVTIITQSLLKDRISKIALWAAISKIDRNSQRQKDDWIEKGRMDIHIAHSGQNLWLDVDYMQDKIDNAERYNLQSILENTEIPVFVINGKQDVTVSFHESQNLYKWCKNKEQSALHLIERCGHTFNIAHPMTESKPQLEELLEKTLEFLRR